MKRLVLVAVPVLIFAATVQIQVKAAKRPNIIIMADDMGYGDSGCYKSRVCD